MDIDGDGFSSCQDDCDDEDADVKPTEYEGDIYCGVMAFDIEVSVDFTDTQKDCELTQDHGAQQWGYSFRTFGNICFQSK